MGGVLFSFRGYHHTPPSRDEAYGNGALPAA